MAAGTFVADYMTAGTFAVADMPAADYTAADYTTDYYPFYSPYKKSFVSFLFLIAILSQCMHLCQIYAYKILSTKRQYTILAFCIFDLYYIYTILP